jgi:GNAT superfamily N-acetyltransferase
MVSHDDYELVVVVDDSNQVVGWMSLAVRLRIEDVPFLQVAALVTDEKIRGKGIGRLLMDHAGKVAQKRSLPYIGLHSSKPRTDAHSFYEHIGYQKAKESFFFKKDMR